MFVVTVKKLYDKVQFNFCRKTDALEFIGYAIPYAERGTEIYITMEDRKEDSEGKMKEAVAEEEKSPTVEE